jgi:hypothetical protein
MEKERGDRLAGFLRMSCELSCVSKNLCSRRRNTWVLRFAQDDSALK